MTHTALVPRQPVPALDVALTTGGRFVLGATPGQNFDMIVFYRGLHCPLCAKYLAEFERLREVVAACHNHASNKGEAFPASLEELVKAELLDAEVLAPRRKPLIYLGKGRTTEEENPESKPLIATEPVRGQRCVAYADGQVTLVDEETYQTQLKLLGKPKP